MTMNMLFENLTKIKEFRLRQNIEKFKFFKHYSIYLYEMEKEFEHV
jgi:hypothetical protein